MSSVLPPTLTCTRSVSYTHLFHKRAVKFADGRSGKADISLAEGNGYTVLSLIHICSSTTTPAKKSNEEIASEVLAGKWGNGTERQKLLSQAGYDYSAVQSIVNKKLSPSKKSVDEIAREVIHGDWGNGTERKNRISAAGYDYSAVQKRVNAVSYTHLDVYKRQVQCYDGGFGFSADKNYTFTKPDAASPDITFQY